LAAADIIGHRYQRTGMTATAKRCKINVLLKWALRHAVACVISKLTYNKQAYPMRKNASPSYVKDSEDLNESLLIHDIARLQKMNFDRRARALGLTRAQWLAVAALRRRPGIKQSELAILLDVEPITVARSIDRLEEAGWVERRTDASDRRVKRLYLTGRMQGVVGQIRTLALGMRRELLNGLTKQDHQKLLQLLQKMKANLDDMDRYE
jgi:MarR family transcriptional regulator, transcriptional regulator for hemolysin